MTVRIFGYWLGTTGFSQHARQFAAALAKLENVVAVPWDLIPPRTPEPGPSGETDVGIEIGAIANMGRAYGRRRVAFVAWETTILPRQQRRILRSFDEIWVPSVWGRNVLLENGFSGDRVVVVPEGVDPQLFQPRSTEAERTPGPFRFLCVAKWETRKGVADLARAFAAEFGPDEPVELILHSASSALPEFDVHAALKSLNLNGHAPITIHPPVPLPTMPDLYRGCDVFVLPTKAEGWGLPILEALSCGIPAIATNYSAPTEYLNEENSYLIKVQEMVAACDPRFFSPRAPLGVWAQPDLRHLRQLMRGCFENPEECRRKGMQGRRDVVKKWTWDHAARIAQKRLQAIEQELRPG